VGRAPRTLLAAAIAAALLAGLRPAYADPAPAGAASAAAAVILDSLVVRIYDNTGVTATERSRAIARADSILDRADVDVEWVDCPGRKSGKASPLCDAAPSRGELVIRMVNSPVADSYGAKRQALGYSLIDTTTGIGTMATVFVDRVTRLAREAHIERATILGRAIAHEIGHLILASNAHADAGLMRETWTVQQLMSPKPQDWLFLPSQSEQLRQARVLQGTGGNTATTQRRLPTNGG
jgi:hypothetical protein